MAQASKKIEKYFEENINSVNELFTLAKEARSKGYDPSTKVDIKLAKNLAERVVGLISVVAPQIADSTVVPRIEELEDKYGKLDWRVAFQIALEVAQEKFCKFKDEKEAIEVGIRVGFAYVTVGVVSSPLEGFTDLELKERLDKKGTYFCLNFAGPIRNAGGTGASVCVLIADYVRKHMGYAAYDGTDKEAERCYTELIDYHSRVTNLQYAPSKEEIVFLIKHIPVEISGMSSEKIEVSNHKDLPRVPTNLIRSGFCLVNSSCIPLKAPKLWKQLRKWGQEFGMDQWNFLEEFLEIQHSAKAGKKDHGSAVEEKTQDKKVLPEDIEEMLKIKKKIDPNYVFIKDLVAGRPVFSHPLRSGGFRLRYGKSRTSGYSAQSIHPATCTITDDFLTTATQVKVELPGKAAALTMCDSIMGPVVLLKDGSVVEVENVEQANALRNDIQEILYIGDILINYGDFFDRAHPLCYPGYCEEWWSQELEKSISEFGQVGDDFNKKKTALSELLKIEEDILDLFIKNPLKEKPSANLAITLSENLDALPLHPKYTYFWSELSLDQFLMFLKWVSQFKIETEDKIIKNMIIPYTQEDKAAKRALELVGLPHFLAKDEFVIIEGNPAHALLKTLCLDEKEKFEEFFSYCSDKKKEQDELLEKGMLEKPLDGGAVLYSINKFSSLNIRDKSGTFIGARMGRPEKAKMRKMQTGPHGLFPVGEQGGRFRSFNEAIIKSHIDAEFELWWDEKEGEESIFPLNYKTGNLCEKRHWNNKEKVMLKESSNDPWVKESKMMKYDFKRHFQWCLKKMDTKVFPDLIKGVLGTASQIHAPENPMKAILRSKHKIFVNKDGTVRYDGSEVPITHFKPKEVGTSLSKLKELGYTHDIYGQPLIDEDQILELFAQDVILPACNESPNEPSDEVFFRVGNFIDEELKYLYGMDPYYNLKKPIDLAGHFLVVLAPHTSAGTIGRIVGFTKTQGLYCHPLMHAAIRRDCDGDEGGVFLLLDAFLNFSTSYLNNKLGATMDAPLVLTSVLNPAEVDDMVFNIERSEKYPLDFYKAAMEGKMPWDYKFELVNDVLGSEGQYEGYTFTHDTSDFNEGVKCSAYKTLPSMKEKLDAQMALGEKLRAVDEADVAKIVIEKHFVKDTRGNLRKFSQQVFRCTKCNTKFRRPPLSGKCTECNTNTIIFTVTEGSIKKYVGYSLELANTYHLPKYLTESLELTSDAIDSIFGEEAEKQEGLGKFF